MKRKKCFLNGSSLLLCACLLAAGKTCAAQSAAQPAAQPAGQPATESDYRNQWLKTEETYSSQQQVTMLGQEKKRDMELYFDMGRDYYSKNEYPSALACFRSVIELESDQPEKKFTPGAQQMIEQIESIMQKSINSEINSLLDQDWDRRKAGLTKILERLQKTDEEKWREEEEMRRAKVEQERMRVKTELDKRRMELDQEVFLKRMEIDREIEQKKLELVKKQMEIDNIFYYAKELYTKGSYSEAIAQADKVLEMDKTNMDALNLKSDALIMIEKQKAFLARKEEIAKEVAEKAQKEKQRLEKIAADKKADDERLAADKKKREEDLAKRAEEKKKRQDEFAKKEQERLKQSQIAAHVSKGKDYMDRKQYLQAIEEFKAVMALDSNNVTAKVSLGDIKTQMDKISAALN